MTRNNSCFYDQMTSASKVAYKAYEETGGFFLDKDDTIRERPERKPEYPSGCFILHDACAHPCGDMWYPDKLSSNNVPYKYGSAIPHIVQPAAVPVKPCPNYMKQLLNEALRKFSKE